MVHRTRLLAVAVAVGFVLGGVAAVASARVVVASPIEVASGSSIEETAAAGFAFDTRGFEMVPLNTSIAVTFFDSDTGGPHTFTIVNDPGVQIPASADLASLLSKDGVLVDLTAVTGSHGGYNNSSFTSPKAAGWYEFVCTEPGHFQAGMYGFIAFGENLPANLTLGSGSPGPGLAVFIIIGTIVALTVLAIVLGFIVGQREGSRHEMPPERLGYPEPSSPEPLPATPGRPPHAP